jgi:hypothetical protein
VRVKAGGQPGVGVDAGLAQPGERQVEPAHCGVLADVAGDVGQLHGDAEVAGAGQRSRRVAHPHQQRHHRADGAGHAHGVGVQVSSGLVAAALGVPGEAFDQRLGQRRAECRGARRRRPSARSAARAGPAAHRCAVEARRSRATAAGSRRGRSTSSSATRQKA